MSSLMVRTGAERVHASMLNSPLSPKWTLLQIYNIDRSNIILYSIIMLDKVQIKKVLKVLLRKSKGLSRLERIEEMDRGLSALNLIVCRDKRSRGLSFIETSTIDYIDSFLKRVQHARLNPKFALRGFVSNPR